MSQDSHFATVFQKTTVFREKQGKKKKGKNKKEKKNINRFFAIKIEITANFMYLQWKMTQGNMWENSEFKLKNGLNV